MRKSRFTAAADHRFPEAGRSGPGGRGGLPAGRFQRAHLLQVAIQVRRHGCRGSPAPEGVGGRERPAQEAAGRGPPGSRSPQDRLRG